MGCVHQVVADLPHGSPVPRIVRALSHPTPAVPLGDGPFVIPILPVRKPSLRLSDLTDRI